MTDSVGAGRLSVGFGVVALAALGWTWALSTLPDFNPANWVRIVGIAVLPVALVGSLVAGIQGLRGPARRPAIVGLVLAGVTVVGFVVLLTIAG